MASPGVGSRHDGASRQSTAERGSSHGEGQCRLANPAALLRSIQFVVAKLAKSFGGWANPEGLATFATAKTGQLLACRNGCRGGGPQLHWKIEGLGKGYWSVSIVEAKTFTTGDLDRDGAESQYVMAYDLDTRQELWATPIGLPPRDGPPCTPTLHADRLWAIGTSAYLVCAWVATGRTRAGPPARTS